MQCIPANSAAYLAIDSSLKCLGATCQLGSGIATILQALQQIAMTWSAAGFHPRHIGCKLDFDAALKAGHSSLSPLHIANTVITMAGMMVIARLLASLLAFPLFSQSLKYDRYSSLMERVQQKVWL